MIYIKKYTSKEIGVSIMFMNQVNQYIIFYSLTYSSMVSIMYHLYVYLHLYEGLDGVGDY